MIVNYSKAWEGIKQLNDKKITFGKGLKPIINKYPVSSFDKREVAQSRLVRNELYEC